MTDVQVVIMDDSEKMKQVQVLLKENSILLDPLTEVTYGVFENKELVATASRYGATIRSVAIRARYQGSNLIAQLMSVVIQSVYDLGYDNVFVFTGQKQVKTFKRLGFFEVVTCNSDVVLLERKPHGLAAYLKTLEAYKVSAQDVGTIVMNANPFTLGHLYLVEEAKKQCDFLFIWVVKENASAVPYEDRLQLIRSGVSHLKQVYVLEGTDYVISKATFPSYFSSNDLDLVTRYAETDLRLFGQHLAPTLGIKKRFVGTEPYCQVTATYNTLMQELLPKYGVEVIEISRKEQSGQVISASRVRQLVLDKQYGLLRQWVPETTLRYLLSDKGKATLEGRLKPNERH